MVRRTWEVVAKTDQVGIVGLLGLGVQVPVARGQDVVDLALRELAELGGVVGGTVVGSNESEKGGVGGVAVGRPLLLRVLVNESDQGMVVVLDCPPKCMRGTWSK